MKFIAYYSSIVIFFPDKLIFTTEGCFINIRDAIHPFMDTKFLSFTENKSVIYQVFSSNIGTILTWKILKCLNLKKIFLKFDWFSVLTPNVILHGYQITNPICIVCIFSYRFPPSRHVFKTQPIL